MSNRSFFREAFASPPVNGPKTLRKIARHHLYTTAPLILDNSCCNKLLLVQSEMLELFVNTLTADDKYSRHIRETFHEKIQMQLSQKPNSFCQFHIGFLKSTSNSEYFEKKKKKMRRIA